MISTSIKSQYYTETFGCNYYCKRVPDSKTSHPYAMLRYVILDHFQLKIFITVSLHYIAGKFSHVLSCIIKAH